MAGQRIIVSVTADTRGFRSAMSQIGKTTGLTKLASGVKSGAAKIWGGFKTIIKGAGLVMLAIAGMAIKGGISRLLALEDAKTQFKSLGVSTGDTDRVMKGLNKTLRGTAFSLDDGATALAGLYSSGRPLKSLNADFELVADAAAFSKQPLGEVNEIFKKISSQGKLTSREMMQFSVRNIPAWQLLSSASGKSVAAFRKDITAGKVSADDFFTLWRKGAQGFGAEGIKMAGAAKHMGDTTKGAWANMLTALNRFGARALDPFFSMAKGGFNGIGNGLDNLADKVEPAAKKMAAWLGGQVLPALRQVGSWLMSQGKVAFEGLGHWISGTALPAARELGAWCRTALLPALKALGAEVGGALSHAWQTLSRAWADSTGQSRQTASQVGGGLVTALRAAGSAMAAVITALGNLGALLARHQGLVKAAAAAFVSWRAVRGITVGVSAGISAVTRTLSTVKGAAGTARTAFGAFRTAMDGGWIGGYRSKLANVASALGKTASAGRTAGQWIGTTVAQGARTATGALSGAASSAGRLAAAMGSRLATGARTVGTAVATGAVQLAAWGKAAAATAVSAARTTAAWIAQKTVLIAQRVATMAATVAQWAMNAAQRANPLGLVITLVMGLVAAIVALWQKNEGFRNGVIGAWNAVRTGVTAAINFIRTIVNGLASYFTQGWTRIGNNAKTTWNGITNWFRTIPQRFLQVFQNFSLPALIAKHWTKIRTGGTAIWNGICGWFRTIPQKLVQAFMNFTLPGLIMKHWDKIKSGATTAWNGITNWFKSIPTKLAHAFMNWSLGRNLLNTWARIRENAANVWNGMVAWFKGIPGRIIGAIAGVANIRAKFSAWFGQAKEAAISRLMGLISTVRSVPGRISAAIGNLGSLLSNAGRALIQGLQNGIQARINGVLSSIRSLGSKVAGAFKSVLGIHSPSRVFTRFGRFIVEGLKAGISGAKAGALALVSKLGAQLATVQEKAIKAETDRLIAARRKQNQKIREWNSKRGKKEKAKLSLPALTKAEAEKQAGKNLKGQLAGVKRAQALIKASEKTTAAVWKRGSDAGTARILSLAKNTAQLGKAVKKQTITLADISKARDNVAAKLGAAKEKLAEAIKLRDDFAQSVQDQARQFASLSNVTADDNGKLTTNDLLKQMRDKLNAVKAFNADMAKLQKLGINQDSYRQLIEAGPEQAAAQAKALAAGGKSAVNQMNSLQGQINSASKNLATAASKNLYQAGVNAAQGIVNGINSQAKALERASINAANIITKQIKKTLGIKSPSRVLKKMGNFTVRGLALGIEDNKPVAIAMRGLSRTVTEGYRPTLTAGELQRREAAASQGGGTTVNVTVSTLTDGPEVGRRVKAALDDYYRRNGRGR